MYEYTEKEIPSLKNKTKHKTTLGKTEFWLKKSDFISFLLIVFELNELILKLSWL